MSTPVRAPLNPANADQSAAEENIGSYPEEISPEQFAWLQDRAAAKRKRWAEHAQSLACNHKS